MAVTITASFPVQLLRIITIAASLLVGLSACGDSDSRPLIPVKYGAFTQTASYSIANQLGYFTAAGLNVTYLQIPNSPYGYAQLLSGGYDVLTGTIDNAVNLRFNAHKNLTVLGQLDGGSDLVIASTQSIKNVADLKGKSIIVDSPVSGYAYILRRVLSAFGLELQNGDYTFQVLLPLRRHSFISSPYIPDYSH
jgi:ABC-type nitrate/sulfonate/bicarbonate transport system substrate-binding protein